MPSIFNRFFKKNTRSTPISNIPEKPNPCKPSKNIIADFNYSKKYEDISKILKSALYDETKPGNPPFPTPQLKVDDVPKLKESLISIDKDIDEEKYQVISLEELKEDIEKLLKLSQNQTGGKRKTRKGKSISRKNKNKSRKNA